MDILHTEMDVSLFAAVLRYQRMVGERNTKLGERKAVRAKANEHTAFKINDDPPRGFSALVALLRLQNSDGMYTESSAVTSFGRRLPDDHQNRCGQISYGAAWDPCIQ